MKFYSMISLCVHVDYFNCCLCCYWFYYVLLFTSYFRKSCLSFFIVCRLIRITVNSSKIEFTQSYSEGRLYCNGYLLSTSSYKVCRLVRKVVFYSLSGFITFHINIPYGWGHPQLHKANQ